LVKAKLRMKIVPMPTCAAVDEPGRKIVALGQ
jgi:hypothetical protein